MKAKPPVRRNEATDPVRPEPPQTGLREALELLDQIESFLSSIEWNDTTSETTAENFREAIRTLPESSTAVLDRESPSGSALLEKLDDTASWDIYAKSEDVRHFVADVKSRVRAKTEKQQC